VSTDETALARFPQEPWLKNPRRRIWVEIAIVLGLSLGASAIYSIVSIIDLSTRATPLASQTATINNALSSREWLDFIYQGLAVFFGLIPVALVLYLLAISGRNPFRRVGFDLTQPGKDVGRGVLLVLAIGIPGLALYFIGHAFGFTVNVVPAPLDTYWWTVPMLILAAVKAALSEELIVVAYLFTRLKELGWARGRLGMWMIIFAAALLRGSYHLYQGIGPFFGNVAMGVVFGWCYNRWGRVMPLVVAHWIIDIASFIGYAWAVGAFPELFRVPA
jgi:membrane protease YdiL (CAAX protease family)